MSAVVFCWTAELFSTTLSARDFKAHNEEMGNDPGCLFDFMFGGLSAVATWAGARSDMRSSVRIHIRLFSYVASDCPDMCVEGHCTSKRCSLQSSILRYSRADASPLTVFYFYASSDPLSRLSKMFLV